MFTLQSTFGCTADSVTVSVLQSTLTAPLPRPLGQIEHFGQLHTEVKVLRGQRYSNEHS